MTQCDSGDGLTEDGEGLCRREATKRVEFTFTKNKEKVKVIKHMCKGCAAHWSLVSPTTVEVLGDIAAV